MGLPFLRVVVSVPLQVPTFRPLTDWPTTLQIFGVETLAEIFTPLVLILRRPAICFRVAFFPTLIAALPSDPRRCTTNLGAENEMFEMVRN